MFKNIGKKIKFIAKFQFVSGIILSIAVAGISWKIIEELFEEEEAYVVAVLVLVIGLIWSWLATFMFYSWGEVVDKTAETAKNTAPFRNISGIENDNQLIEKITEATELYKKGLISDNEFIDVVSEKVTNKQ